MNNANVIDRAATPLARSWLTVNIVDLLAAYEMRHAFSNTGDTAIEAVYSFPVPLDAAFLGMEATIGGETRVAQVMPATRAARRYDDAVGDGDSAVLLERLEPGMLCVSLGNLMPGESGEVVLRFAAALAVADRIARFNLPLVHRPRYGRYCMDEWKAPRADFAVEHPLDAEIHVRGLLADCPVQSTHGMRFERHDEGMSLRLPGLMLNRDVAFHFELGERAVSASRWIADGDRSLALLTFAPSRLDEAAEKGRRRPLELCLVLDGSGSMSGDAIMQTRDALRAVAAELGDGDRIQILRFGSSVKPMFRRPLRATARVLDAVRGLASTVEADMGGTAMGRALEAAMDALAGPQDETSGKVVLLVTDGAVQPRELDRAREQAIRLGIRIFVIAVGGSAGTDVLFPLADATGATLERAMPGEPVDAGVMRHIRRARQDGPLQIGIDWGTPDVRQVPLGNVYEGDAVIALAQLSDWRPITAQVRIVRTGDRFDFTTHDLQQAPQWRAWCGQQIHHHARPEEREAVAMRHGLITDETSAVLVKLRAAEDKAEGLPEIVPVKHMVPEGMLAASMPRMAFHSAHAYGQAVASGIAEDDFCEGEDFAMPASRPGLPSHQPAMEAAPSPVHAGTLTPDQKEAAERVLLRVLVGALLDDPLDPFDGDGLLLRIDAQDRALVRQYLDEECRQISTRRGARALLLRLLGRVGGIELTDEQEATLALLGA